LKRTLRVLKLVKRMNWPMTLAVIVLLVIGIFFVFSSCYVSDEQPVRSLYKKQIAWMAVGIAAYVAFAVGDYRLLRRYSWLIYGACVFLLVAVLFIGTEIYGATRWLMFLGVGVQPSELAKLATIIVLARKLSRPGIDLGEVRSLAVILGIVALPVLLVLKQPDLGTAMVFLPTALVMIFAAGLPMRVLGVLVMAGVLGVGIVLGALFLPERVGMSEVAQDRVLRMTGLSRYHKDRISVFFKADEDPLGVGWNKMQSEIAVGSGGAWGKGFLKGTQNVLGFLPRSVAPTDFIYSVIAEEKGFFGSVVIIFLFGVVIVAGTLVSLVARDRMGRLLCMGIVALLFTHVFINIAMTVGLMPITGLPLPLLSYGGSFMVVVMSALGIIQSVYIRSRPAAAGQVAQSSFFSFD